jgi:hypothetical protein
MSTCHVTLFNAGTVKSPSSRGNALPRCGQPVVAHGLCAQHYADRIRLGGTP